jgi:hypothetical protein
MRRKKRSDTEKTVAFPRCNQSKKALNCRASRVTPSLGTTPLPSTWLMLLGGLAGLAFFVLRATKKNAAELAAA